MAIFSVTVFGGAGAGASAAAAPPPRIKAKAEANDSDAVRAFFREPRKTTPVLA
jgi:hypothetical protein